MMSFDGRSVAVEGSGRPAREIATALAERGAAVTVVDSDQSSAQGASALPRGLTLLVTTSEAPPTAPLLAEAAGRGIEIIGAVELAWRLRGPRSAPWLVLTGSDGAEIAGRLLTSILTAAGRTTGSGTVLSSVLSPEPVDAIVVPISSIELHWSSTIRPHIGLLLNLRAGRTEWHGSFQEYALTKGRVFDADTSIGNADDEVVRTLQNRARGRRVSFTLQTPRVGELGVVEHLLVDRAFPDVVGEATEIAVLDDVQLPGDHQVLYALAAAAMARAFGVPAVAVAEGLRAVR